MKVEKIKIVKTIILMVFNDTIHKTLSYFNLFNIWFHDHNRLCKTS